MLENPSSDESHVFSPLSDTSHVPRAHPLSLAPWQNQSGTERRWERLRLLKAVNSFPAGHRLKGGTCGAQMWRVEHGHGSSASQPLHTALWPYCRSNWPPSCPQRVSLRSQPPDELKKCFCLWGTRVQWLTHGRQERCCRVSHSLGEKSQHFPSFWN